MIDDDQNPESPAVLHLIVHKVHAPVVIGRRRSRRLATQQRNALAAFDLHAQLQPFQPIQPLHALLAHSPAFSFEHDQYT